MRTARARATSLYVLTDDGSGARGTRQSLQSLERGIAVIQVFSRERPALTLSEVARLTGITRATARRILLTLEDLGHVRSDGRRFSLTPRVLTLGWAYLSSLNLWEIAQPLMEELVERDQRVLLGGDARPARRRLRRARPTRRIMTIALGVGTRLPAHCHLDGARAARGAARGGARPFLAATPLERTPSGRSPSPTRLRRTIDEVREQGWALVDQELEIGLRSIAAPMRRRRAHGRRAERLGGRSPGPARAAARAVPARAAEDRRADLDCAGAPAPPRAAGRRPGAARDVNAAP